MCKCRGPPFAKRGDVRSAFLREDVAGKVIAPHQERHLELDARLIGFAGNDDMIRRAILEAAPNAIEIGDRREAMATAIAELDPGDLLVIAGKGHETSQIIGTETHPFDDVAVAREFARARWPSAA